MKRASELLLIGLLLAGTAAFAGQATDENRRWHHHWLQTHHCCSGYQRNPIAHPVRQVPRRADDCRSATVLLIPHAPQEVRL